MIGLQRNYYRLVAGDNSVDATIRKLIWFHTLGMRSRQDAESHRILPLFPSAESEPIMPQEDEIAEDAGLFDHEKAS